MEDSSFEPTCRLCQSPLANEECLRLTCYRKFQFILFSLLLTLSFLDIFHLRCINNIGIEKGINVHPSQHICPDCRRPIFPLGSVGPVWDQIHSKLADQEWARHGLSQTGNGFINHHEVETNHVIPQVIHNNPNPSAALPINVSGVSNFIGSGSTRTRHDNRQSESHIPLLDVDEDKYQIKPASEFVSRWFRNRRSSLPKAPRTFKHWLIAGILLLICFVTLIHYLIQLGRDTASRDISLDPAFNPDIRVAD